MSIGKDPHRPEGKKGADEYDEAYLKDDAPDYPSYKETYQKDLDTMREVSHPAEYSAERQVGGSRPFVESRVKEANVRREAREARGEEEEAQEAAAERLEKAEERLAREEE